MPTLLTIILTGLRAAIARIAPKIPARTALLVLAWNRISRAATRYERLFAQFRAGTLPQPGAPRPPRPARPRQPLYLPTRPAWLIAECREAAAIACQLQHFLVTEEAAEFIAAVPRAGRILRPLCRMLGITAPNLHPTLPDPPSPHPPPKSQPHRAPPPTPAIERCTFHPSIFRRFSPA